jgi:putative tryptophan/tyrosine transport system permease protein
MTLVIGAFTMGLILSLLAIGVLISFRIFSFPDITPEGSITFGAAIAAILLVKGLNPWIATTAGFAGGFLAGIITGILHTRFKINGLLAGILVMTALYSTNLRVMGKSNVPLLTERTVATYCEDIGHALLPGALGFTVAGWEVALRDAFVLLFAFLVALLMGGVLFLFMRTNIGTAMRATGDNSQMMKALGVNVNHMIVLGLGISNGFVGLAGALLAQYQGFADVQMGIGMVVLGLASVIIGEALVGSQRLGFTIVGAVMGSVLFRLLVAIALRWGLNPNDLKLITAIFVFVALILPQLLGKLKRHARSPESV